MDKFDDFLLPEVFPATRTGIAEPNGRSSLAHLSSDVVNALIQTGKEFFLYLNTAFGPTSLFEKVSR
jgi:hypothetical protein